MKLWEASVISTYLLIITIACTYCSPFDETVGNPLVYDMSAYYEKQGSLFAFIGNHVKSFSSM